MNKNKIEFLSNQAGAALTIRAIPSKNKTGLGRVHKEGYVDFYIPIGKTDLENKKIIVDEFARIASVANRNIEIMSGKNGNYLLMIIGVSSETLNQIIDQN